MSQDRSLKGTWEDRYGRVGEPAHLRERGPWAIRERPKPPKHPKTRGGPSVLAYLMFFALITGATLGATLGVLALLGYSI